ncbi:MAG: hypothetical protein JSV89_21780 [Spirochaetaceae bacterium]|nr:MAG: hypothetical protein JSV89_21780 [Spirochaetaceae bacterium]
MQKKVRFELEGKVYDVGIERTGDRLTLTHQGKSYVVRLLPDESEPRVSPPKSAAHTPYVTPVVQAPLPPVGGTAAAVPVAEADSAGALHAPMTGVIKEIKVAPGHTVQEGQVVLIMEAMKMDIDVPSPISGIVAEVLVKAGDTVAAKQELIVIH